MNTTRVKFKAVRIIEYEFSDGGELSVLLEKRGVHGEVYFNGNVIRETLITPIWQEIVTTGDIEK